MKIAAVVVSHPHTKAAKAITKIAVAVAMMMMTAMMKIMKMAMMKVRGMGMLRMMESDCNENLRTLPNLNEAITNRNYNIFYKRLRSII